MGAWAAVYLLEHIAGQSPRGRFSPTMALKPSELGCFRLFSRLKTKHCETGQENEKKPRSPTPFATFKASLNSFLTIS
jgi:hypothetical protein